MSSPSRVAWRTLFCCSLFAATDTPAQTSSAIPAAPPSHPPGPVIPVATDSGYVEWIEASEQRGTLAEMGLHESGTLRIVVLPVSALRRARHAPSLRAVSEACVAVLGGSVSDAEALAARAPWQEFDAAAARVPTIAISVSFARAQPTECEGVGEPKVASLANGIVFASDSLPPPSRGVAAVEVWVDGERLPPLLAGRVPTVRVGRGAATHDGPAQTRLYFAADAFVPHFDGRRPLVVVLVWEDGATEARRVPLPQTIVDAAWKAQLAWRAVRLDDAPKTDAILPLPVPQDSVLRAARAAYRAGDLGRASSDAYARLSRTTTLSVTDRITTQMQLGVAFAGASEELAARHFLTEALRAEPCLFLPATAPDEVRRLMDLVRPPAPCDSRRVLEVVRAALLPGGAQLTRRSGLHLLAGTAVLTATVWQLSGALINRRLAIDAYEDYRHAEDFLELDYRRAERLRRTANRHFVNGTVIWSGSLIIGVITEWRRDDRLSQRRDYGAHATRAFGPVDPPRTESPR